MACKRYVKFGDIFLPLLARGESDINIKSIPENSKPGNIFMACVKCFWEKRTNQEEALQVSSCGMFKACDFKKKKYMYIYSCQCLMPMVTADK